MINIIDKSDMWRDWIHVNKWKNRPTWMFFVINPRDREGEYRHVIIESLDLVGYRGTWQIERIERRDIVGMKRHVIHVIHVQCSEREGTVLSVIEMHDGRWVWQGTGQSQPEVSHCDNFHWICNTVTPWYCVQSPYTTMGDIISTAVENFNSIISSSDWSPPSAIYSNFNLSTWTLPSFPAVPSGNQVIYTCDVISYCRSVRQSHVRLV